MSTPQRTTSMSTPPRNEEDDVSESEYDSDSDAPSGDDDAPSGDDDDDSNIVNAIDIIDVLAHIKERAASANRLYWGKVASGEWEADEVKKTKARLASQACETQEDIDELARQRKDAVAEANRRLKDMSKI
jgi:hypothetical protein